MALAEEFLLSTHFSARIRANQLNSYHCQLCTAGCGFGIAEPGTDNRRPGVAADFATMESRAFILDLFVRQTKIGRRKLQYCFGRCQKEIMTVAKGKKLYRVVRL